MKLEYSLQENIPQKRFQNQLELFPTFREDVPGWEAMYKKYLFSREIRDRMADNGTYRFSHLSGAETELSRIKREYGDDAATGIKTSRDLQRRTSYRVILNDPYEKDFIAILDSNKELLPSSQDQKAAA